MTIPGVPEATGLRVGFVPGVTLTKWRTIWRQRHPRVPLELVEVSVKDQDRVLYAGDVDMCFVRLPVSTEGLHVIRLYEETPVVWVAKDHPVAAFDAVVTADLAGEQVLEKVDAGSIDLVVQGEAVLRVPQSIARSNSRRDLTYREVSDAPPTTVALAWRVENHHESIDDFIGVVRGRTVNSSRTVQDRRGGKREVTKRPKPTGTSTPNRPSGRRQRRRRR